MSNHNIVATNRDGQVFLPERGRVAAFNPENELTKKDRAEYSFSRLLHALSQGKPHMAPLEMEVSNYLSTYAREGNEGHCVPISLLTRDITYAGESADLVQTDVSTSLIESLKNRTVALRAGAQRLSGLQGDVSIPRVTGDPDASWYSEGGTVTESTPTFDSVTLTANQLSAHCEASRKLILQSSIDVDRMLRGMMLDQVALAIDAAVINGSGTNNEPEGIIGGSGVGTIDPGTGSVTADRSMLLDLIEDVETASALDDSAVFLLNPKVYRALTETEVSSGSGRFVVESNNFQDFPIFRSNQLPTFTGNLASAIFGVFSNVIIGEWGSGSTGGASLIVNPYTQAKTGVVEWTLHVWVDIALRHPEAFSTSVKVDVS